jgi:hypothetical protein
MTKPATTSAAATAFCAAKLDGPGGFLWIDGNGKITAGNGTLDEPKPNAFSLVHIEDCPGSTPTCRASCYVHGLHKHAPDTFALYEHNSREIRRIIESPHDLEWANILAHWMTANCAGGFRWHVSGDIFSLVYAKFITTVCSYSPNVDHWIYTRSIQYAPNLMEASMTRGGNLAINISADRDNYDQAREVADRLGLRVCYMTQGVTPGTMRNDDVIFPDYALRGGNAEGQSWFGALPANYKAMVCPVDYHGKSERRRCGPCDRCLR